MKISEIYIKNSDFGDPVHKIIFSILYILSLGNKNENGKKISMSLWEMNLFI